MPGGPSLAYRPLPAAGLDERRDRTPLVRLHPFSILKRQGALAILDRRFCHFVAWSIRASHIFIAGTTRSSSRFVGLFSRLGLAAACGDDFALAVRPVVNDLLARSGEGLVGVDVVEVAEAEQYVVDGVIGVFRPEAFDKQC
jgi:hypothetical protein